MKKQVFAVCDPEKEYACKFMEYLNDRNNLPFEVQAFTTVQSLIDFAGKTQIELLLISADAMSHEIQELNIGKVIILTEGAKPEGFDSYNSVYKYQASSDIVREVMACYTAERDLKGKQVSVLKKSTKIIGIYSPLGRCFKTSFALALGLVLADTQPVLYINMEEYSGFEELFGKNFSYTLSDLLYYVRQGDTNLSVRLNGVVQNAGKLDFIPPVRSPEDIHSTSRNEWECLLSEMILHSSYEIVVLDIGNGIADGLQMLDLCSRIFMPVRTDPVSECKIRQFEEYVRARDCAQVLDKTVKIKLPYRLLPANGMMWPEQLKWSELGEYAKELIRKESL